MSFDFPPSVREGITQYAEAEQITTDAAAIKLVQAGLKSVRRRSKTSDLVTDEQINQLKALDTSYGLLEDVSEEKIDCMARTIQRMKRERFGAIG